MRWAASDMSGPLPWGDLGEATRLADPGPDLLLWAGRLAAVTAARLRLPAPLFGDGRPPGLSAVLVAAAIGAQADSERAALLLRAVQPPARAADLLAHHGLAAAANRLLPGLRDRLLDLSPLTGVLDRPGPRTVAACEDLLDRLRQGRASRAMVVLRFAAPPDTPEQASWRGECLAYLRHDDPGFVLDVYETALLHHRREHEIRARVAWQQVLGPGPAGDAMPTAMWWRALAELEAAQPHQVRERPLLIGRRVGTNLFRHIQALESA